MVWLLIGALGVLIAKDFGLTPSQKGLLVALPLLSGALLRIVVGVCGDRFGIKPTGYALLVGQGIALIWGWLGATTYGHLLGVGLLLGVAGASFAVALPLASRAYPPAHQGFAMGVAAAGNSGVVLAAFLAPRLEHMVGWHGVFGLMAIPVALTAIVFALAVQEEPKDARGAGGAWASLRDGVRQQSMQWLSFLYAVTFGGFVGLASFLPMFFYDQYAVSPVIAGTMTAACGLAGSVLRPVGGYVADRMSGLLVLRFLFPALAVLAVVMAQLPAVEWATGLTVATLATMGFGNGVVFQVVSDHYRQHIGVATGLVGAAGGIGGFFLPSVFGLLKDLTGSYEGGFLVLGVLAVMAWRLVEKALRRQLSVNPAPRLGSVSH